MRRRLPTNPDIEFYRKRAKALLRSYRAHEESAIVRIGNSRSRVEICLADAQKAVAHESGFSSWVGLRTAVRNAVDLPDETTSAFTGDKLRQETAPPRQKQRYANDPNVQRWLKTQRSEETDGFASSFLSSHREHDWIISSLGAFYAEGHITDVVGAVKAGKEATVYRCATPVPHKFLAAKVYRPRMFRNLQNDAVYRENRMRGKDRRSQKAMGQMSRQGRAFRMESWIKFEFDSLRRVYEAGADVPKPVARHGNAILMEFVGDESASAPMLQHAELLPEEVQPLFAQLVRNIEIMLSCDRVHADLSPYNVLFWNGQAMIIDFAQSVDGRVGPDVFQLFLRDIDKTIGFFRKYGINADTQEIAIEMWSRYCRGKPGQ